MVKHFRPLVTAVTAAVVGFGGAVNGVDAAYTAESWRLPLSSKTMEHNLLPSAHKVASSNVSPVYPAATAASNRPVENGAEEMSDPAAVDKKPVRIDPGEKRPADQFKTDVLGRPLTIGGRYELDGRYIEDRRLDPNRADDVANVSQDFQLEAYYPWSQTLSFFLQADYFYDPEVYSEEHDASVERGLKLGQAWAFFSQIFDSDFNLQIGRQRFADKRQWWTNEQLDAVRLYFASGQWFAELSVAEEIGSKRTDKDFVDPINDQVLRLMGDVIWQWDEKQNVGLFLFSQFDHGKKKQLGARYDQDFEDKADGDLTWLGVRAMGKVKVPDVGKFAYWVDSAFVSGRETQFGYSDVNERVSRLDSQFREDVLGWGVDTGITYYSKWPLHPYFTVGYARGSGDSDQGDGVDHTFRQSGLHNNKSKFASTQRFRYYGELFRPELANMQIVTAAIGFPLSEQSAVDVLYHHYNQAIASKSIRDSKIRREPDGLDNELGDELDVVVSLDEWKHVQMQFTGAVFRAGDAFGAMSGNTSFLIGTTFRYSF